VFESDSQILVNAIYSNAQCSFEFGTIVSKPFIVCCPS